MSMRDANEPVTYAPTADEAHAPDGTASNATPHANTSLSTSDNPLSKQPTTHPTTECASVNDTTIETMTHKKGGGGGDDNNNNNNDGSTASGGDDDGGNAFTRVVHRIVPNGGVVSGTFNLAAGSIGGGILGLASGFDVSGMAMGTVYLFIIFLLTVYSMQLLAFTAAKTGIRSYEGLGRCLFGKGGDIFVAIIMFIKCFGSCITYVISIGDVWGAFMKDDSVHGYYRTTSFKRVLIVITFFVCMLPLSLPKRINSLRYVSLFSVIFMLYFVICVIVHAGMHGMSHSEQRGNTKAVGTGNKAIGGLGVFMFAYLCQSNMFEVWNEIKPKPTVARMTLESFVGMLICTILYWLTGFCAYMDFGSKISGSLLNMYYPVKDTYFAVAYIGVVIKLCVAFSLHILPARDAVQHVIGWNINTVAWWKNAVLCTILCGIALVLGLFIPDVTIVFNLLGSFTGSFIAFVFPAMFYIYAGNFTIKGVGWYNYFGTYFLLLCGIIAICFGTTATIYGLV